MAEQIPIRLRVSLDAAEAERTIVRFLKDYAEDAGRPQYVVGLSGGLDSAVAGSLAVRAIGASRVHGLILPDDDTPVVDVEDARRVAKWLGVRAPSRPIQSIVDAVAAVAGTMDRTSLGNVKARTRMVLLHAEAANRGGLVLGTGNKSELLCGYFSKFGDAGVDVQPIGDLYKTQVRILAAHLGVPQAILDKVPTAGLWAGQTDEDELGIAYERLDRILLGLELRLPSDQIAQIVDVPETEVARIEDIRRRSQHKRRVPMAPKIGLRTVGLDWRAPTLEG